MHLVYLFLALIAVSLGLAAPISHAGVQLVPDDFKGRVATGLWFIELYSSYCHHCREFAPTWKRFVESRKGNDAVQLGQIDCSVFGDLCSAEKVKGYPTLRLYSNGQATREFSGDRDVKSLEAFLGKYAPTKTLPDPMGLDQDIEEDADEASPPVPQPEAPAKPAQAHDVAGKVVAAPVKPGPPQKAPARLADEDFKVEEETPALVLQGRGTNIDGEVRVLDETSLSDVVDGKAGPTFVKFFAPWCSHCKAMAPTWEELAKAMQNKVNIAQLDCDAKENKRACSSQRIQGFPTLVMFVEGQRREYNGPRSLGAMRSFAEKSSASTGLLPLPSGGLEAVRADHDVIFLLLQSDGEATETIVDMAAKTLFGAAPVYRSSSAALEEAYAGSSSAPILVVFKSPLSSPLASRIIAADDTAKTISHWLRDWRLPVVNELTSATMTDLLDDGSGARVVIIAVPLDDREATLTEVRDTAAAWKERRSEKVPTRFIWADANRLTAYLKRNYGITSLSSVSVVIVDPSSQRFWSKDATGSPLDLSHSLYTALEAHSRHQLAGGQHSLGKVERAAEAIGKRTEGALMTLARHPILTICGLVGGFLGLFILLMKLLDAPEASMTVKKD